MVNVGDTSVRAGLSGWVQRREGAEYNIHFSRLPDCGCNAINQSPQLLTPAFPVVMESPSTVNRDRAFLS